MKQSLCHGLLALAAGCSSGGTPNLSRPFDAGAATQTDTMDASTAPPVQPAAGSQSVWDASDDPDASSADAALPPPPTRCDELEPQRLEASPGSATGRILDWPETGESITFTGLEPQIGERRLTFSQGPEDELIFWWSIAGRDSGYFYTVEDPNRVALVPMAATFAEIGDASGLAYGQRTTVVPVGGFVVFHNTTTGRYLALRLDSIVAPYFDGDMDPPFCIGLDATWQFAPSGGSDFSDVAAAP